MKPWSTDSKYITLASFMFLSATSMVGGSLILLVLAISWLWSSPVNCRMALLLSSEAIIRLQTTAHCWYQLETITSRAPLNRLHYLHLEWFLNHLKNSSITAYQQSTLFD